MAQVSKVSTGNSVANNAEAPPSDLDGFIGYHMKRAYVTLSTDFRRALGEDGFAPRVFSAMSLIVQFPNITQSELARKLGIERSGLVAIIDELEQRSFVRRQPVPGDRVHDHENQLLSHMTTAEKATLVSLLQKIRKTEG